MLLAPKTKVSPVNGKNICTGTCPVATPRTRRKWHVTADKCLKENPVNELFYKGDNLIRKPVTGSRNVPDFF